MHTMPPRTPQVRLGSIAFSSSQWAWGKVGDVGRFGSCASNSREKEKFFSSVFSSSLFHFRLKITVDRRVDYSGTYLLYSYVAGGSLFFSECGGGVRSVMVTPLKLVHTYNSMQALSSAA